MKYIQLMSTALVLSVNIAIAQGLRSMRLEFERHYEEKSLDEAIRGSIYYQNPGKVTVVVNDPVNQWMVLEKNEMSIFYPAERAAFRIIAKTPFSLPFFQVFLSVAKEDHGLTDMGYTIAGHEKKGDTLVSYWNPEEKVSRMLGKFKMVYVSNRIVCSELRKPDGTILGKTFYSNHIHYGANDYPLKIFTVRYIKGDSTFERVIYSNPQFNIALPKEILDFKIPSDIEVKEIEW